MYARTFNGFLQIKKLFVTSIDISRNYAKPAVVVAKKKKSGPIVEKKVLPVETDINRLLTYVCGSNIMKEGEDVKIKPDNEYPDWLWNIHIGPPLTLEQLDPESKKYWLKVRKMGLKRNNQLSKVKKF
ncbi:39S ribosomal protein L54, mitochondrial-like [Ctenocephalides felis]|uniref:39S ribosomal protein L54, mitochondrial-like n=1 Tax=Ctenocephalides felis TaxID=7515 RepID=UPI000E6E3334|nr:39S ribosomal protein L54, mitochondrial-like [Ctenocephalides felis]XP_026480568.1 39S ribosomal protein L54, mitochondrial-like [Ctenocephalides felis]